MEWFNQVDSTYRSDLREINESNFARFDAKLEQRFAEQDAWIERRFAEFEVRMEKRLAQMDLRLERGLKEQMRFLYVALAAQVALILGLYTR